MAALKGKANDVEKCPDLMASRDFRAEKARCGLDYGQFPLARPTLRKILAGDPSVMYLALIIAGARVGMRPRIVWEPIPTEEKAV